MIAKKDVLERVGLRLPPDVKAWYTEESIKMGLSMGQYMTYVLVMHQRNTESMKAVKTLTEMSKMPEIQEANKEMLELMKSPAFKEFMKQYEMNPGEGLPKLP